MIGARRSRVGGGRSRCASRGARVAALLALLVALAVFGAAILRLLRSDISVPAWQILFSCALSLLGIVVGGYLETLLVGPCFLLFEFSYEN